MSLFVTYMLLLNCALKLVEEIILKNNMNCNISNTKLYTTVNR